MHEFELAMKAYWSVHLLASLPAECNDVSPCGVAVSAELERSLVAYLSAVVSVLPAVEAAEPSVVADSRVLALDRVAGRLLVDIGAQCVLEMDLLAAQRPSDVGKDVDSYKAGALAVDASELHEASRWLDGSVVSNEPLEFQESHHNRYYRSTDSRQHPPYTGLATRCIGH